MQEKVNISQSILKISKIQYLFKSQLKFFDYLPRLFGQINLKRMQILTRYCSKDSVWGFRIIISTIQYSIYLAVILFTFPDLK